MLNSYATTFRAALGGVSDGGAGNPATASPELQSLLEGHIMETLAGRGGRVPPSAIPDSSGALPVNPAASTAAPSVQQFPPWQAWVSMMSHR